MRLDPEALTWRGFLVRLRGLGESSVWRAYRRYRAKHGPVGSGGEDLTDPVVAERYFENVMGVH